MTLNVVAAVALFGVAAAAIVQSANAVFRRRARGIPAGAGTGRYRIFAGGCVVMAVGCLLEGLAVLRYAPLAGLVGLIVMLVGIGLTIDSRRAVLR